MLVSLVHSVAVLNAAFCMTCSVCMFVLDARGDHEAEAYSRRGHMIDLWVAKKISFCFPNVVALNALWHVATCVRWLLYFECVC